MSAALRILNEGPFGMPSKECCGIGTGVGAEELQEFRIEGLLLCLIER